MAPTSVNKQSCCCFVLAPWHFLFIWVAIVLNYHTITLLQLLLCYLWFVNMLYITKNRSLASEHTSYQKKAVWIGKEIITYRNNRQGILQPEMRFKRFGNLENCIHREIKGPKRTVTNKGVWAHWSSEIYSAHLALYGYSSLDCKSYYINSIYIACYINTILILPILCSCVMGFIHPILGCL